MVAELKRPRSSGGRKYNNFVKYSAKYGWLAAGQEELCRVLLLESAFGNDLAVAQLRDIYLDAEMDGKAEALDAQVAQFRQVCVQWSKEERRTFLRHLQSNGVYRQRDSRAKKAPRTSAEPKPAQSAV